MADILIRKLDSSVVLKLDELAAKKNMSREEFLRKTVESLVIAEDLKAVENKYENLVNAILEKVEQNNQIIQKNTEVITRINDKLE